MLVHSIRLCRRKNSAIDSQPLSKVWSRRYLLLTDGDQNRNRTSFTLLGEEDPTMFRNILVPLDGSFVGETALPYARTLAGRTGAALTLVRAAQTPMLVGDRVLGQARAVAQAEDYLSAQAQDLAAAGFTVLTGVPFGRSPATWIVEEVGMRHADLIVMATHDRSGPNRWLHGSVAEAVVNRASVPVLLIRAADGTRPIERFSAQTPALVVPLDGSSLAEAALPVAYQLANAIGGHVVLVGVISTPGQLIAEEGGAIGMYVGSEHARLEADAREYLDTIASRLSAHGRSVDASVRQGVPASQIDDVAREHDAAAVVMATHGRTGLARALMGSVAGEVLRRGKCPVMLVHPPELRPAEEPVPSQSPSSAPVF
jgi:nucleotide-binding universal stress UspA family protein